MINIQLPRVSFCFSVLSRILEWKRKIMFGCLFLFKKRKKKSERCFPFFYLLSFHFFSFSSPLHTWLPFFPSSSTPSTPNFHFFPPSPTILSQHNEDLLLASMQAKRFAASSFSSFCFYFSVARLANLKSSFAANGSGFTRWKRKRMRT